MKIQIKRIMKIKTKRKMRRLLNLSEIYRIEQIQISLEYHSPRKKQYSKNSQKQYQSKRRKKLQKMGSNELMLIVQLTIIIYLKIIFLLFHLHLKKRKLIAIRQFSNYNWEVQNKYMSITNTNNQLNHTGTQRPNEGREARIQSSSPQTLETLNRKSQDLNTQRYQQSVDMMISQPKIRDGQEMQEQMEMKHVENNQRKNIKNEQKSKMEGKSNQCNKIQSNTININSSLENEEEQHKNNQDKTIKYNKKIRKSKRKRFNKNSTPGQDNSIQSEVSSNSYQFSQSNQNLQLALQNQSQNMLQASLINSIICYLCEEPIIFATETICGHAFCEHCLTEYMLVSVCCPICGSRIRDKRGASNKKIDEIVQQFCQHLGKQYLQELKERKQNRRKLKQQRRIMHIHAGLQVDVRDDDYIWKRARVLRTFNRISSDNVRLKFIIIQYSESYKKQEFSANCPRIARAGYYTNREQVPRNALQLHLILEEEKRCIQNRQRKVKLEFIEKQKVKIEQNEIGQQKQMMEEINRNYSLNEKQNQQLNFQSKQ